MPPDLLKLSEPCRGNGVTGARVVAVVLEVLAQELNFCGVGFVEELDISGRRDAVLVDVRRGLHDSQRQVTQLLHQLTLV